MKNLYLILFIIFALNANAQNVTIPDANFKAALLANTEINTDGDPNEISEVEAAAFTGFLNVFRLEISDATGLEAFTNLTKINIASNNLTSLDVSSLTNLTFLSCSSNQLAEIDLTENILLDTLAVNNTELTSVDVSGLPLLRYLDVGNNDLTSLDVTNNLALGFLGFGTNNITDFQFPTEITTTLMSLAYGGNPISNTFDFTQFPNLAAINCNSSDLTSLDVSMMSNLHTLVCIDNPLTDLDLTHNPELYFLYAGHTSIRHLDLSQNPKLENLNLRSVDGLEESLIATINLANGNNEGLKYLYLDGTSYLHCIEVDNPENPFPNIAYSSLDGFSNFTDICVSGGISFVDKAFEEAVLTHDPVIDQNLDGAITDVEAAAFSGVLDLSHKGIKNARELEYFTNITGLNLLDNKMTNLDLSNNSSLTTLDLSYITELSVLSLDNGNNEAITSITMTGTFNRLNCITVDDPTYSENNWTTVPAGTGFSTDCEVTFADVNFKNALLADGHDLNEDDEIQVSEAEAVTGLLSYVDMNIGNLLGIEAFINVEELNFGDPTVYEGVSSMNLTQNTKLRKLYLYGNRLTGIDLSCNPLLKDLYANNGGNTSFTNLDLSKNRSLVNLSIQNSHFVEVNVTGCTALKLFSAASNNITSLDLSSNISLYDFYASGNNLSYLNIKNGNNENLLNFVTVNNPELMCVTVDDVAYAQANFTNKDTGTYFDFDCDDLPIEFPDANLETALLNHVPAIDLNDDGEIRFSEAAGFDGILDLSASNISDATGLVYFTSITGLDISDNQLTSLIIKNSNNVNFTVFDARGNASLTCISVDNTTYSTENWPNIDAGASFSAYCDAEELVYIPDAALKNRLINSYYLDTNDDEEISYGEALNFTGEFNTNNSTLITDMTGIEALENLTGLTIDAYTSINSLNLSTLTSLTKLVVSQHIVGDLNQIDISNNLLLEDLLIFNVPMTGLDLSQHTMLEGFNCKYCELTSLDLSQNTLLESLSLDYNNLTSLDLSNNTELNYLSLEYNQLNALDLTGLSLIEDLQISGNNFTEIDLSMLVNLKEIYLVGTNVTRLDLSNSPLIERIDSPYGYDEGEVPEDNTRGKLEEVMLPPNPTELFYVDLPGNNIQFIDLSMIPFDPDGYVNIQLQGNDLYNINIGKVDRLGIYDNPNLTCAQTTDVAYAEANYQFDEGLSFNTYCASRQTSIVSFSVEGQKGESSIDTELNTVQVVVRTDADLSALVPMISVSPLAAILPNPEAAQDFTDPVVYTVTAEDGITAKDWTITVSKNAQPDNIQLTKASIEENNVGNDEIGTLSTSDPDEEDTHTYTLVAGEGDTDNSAFEISGDQLKASQSFDFETQSSYSIRVQTDDGYGGVLTQVFVITIIDQDDDVVTALKDIDTWRIYPNPATDWIRLEGNFTAEALLRLYDLSGNSMIKSKVPQDGKLELPAIEPGLYFISISDQDITTTTKILIHR